MILILAEADDSDALWLRAALAECVEKRVTVLTPTQLVCARSIVHRMSSDGGDFTFVFADGSSLGAGEVHGLVNRMSNLPTAHLAFAADGDRDYAAAELQAFLLGWLASLSCPMLNPPAPESLVGAWHNEVAALHLATIAGLRCRPAGTGADGPLLPPSGAANLRHFIIDGRVVGPILPAAERDVLEQFSHLWGARLLQVDTVIEEGRLTFVDASVLPRYPTGGRPLVRAMAQVLSA